MAKQVRAIDVGQYIIDAFIRKDEGLTTLKLQKLVFYSQAFSLVWDDAPLFHEDFQAWINGPVAPSLFKALKEYYYCPKKIRGADAGRLPRTRRTPLTRSWSTTATLPPMNLQL